MSTLKDVKVGSTVTVKKIAGEGPVKRRIMDMASQEVYRFMCVRLRLSVIL